MEQWYLQSKNPESVDERYFIQQHEKLKTPLKMSPFGARAGPMIRNMTMNPPAMASKRNLFGKTPNSLKDDDEPPMKRLNNRQNEAPGANLN